MGADRIGPGVVVDVTLDNGANAMLRFDGPQNETAYGILDIGTETRTRRVNGNEQGYGEMYDRFLGALIDAVQGHRDDTNRLVDGSRLLLTAHAAL